MDVGSGGISAGTVHAYNWADYGTGDVLSSGRRVFHTHDIRKYTLRLGLFAVVSAFAFYLFERRAGMAGGGVSLGMIYTLFLALLAIRTYDSHIGEIKKA